MIIPIIFHPPSSTPSQPSIPAPLARISHSELLLLEFQGEIHVNSEDAGGKDGQLVGTLTIDEALTLPSLRIGHHQLEGKLVTLPKPLAVLQKQPINLDQEESEDVTPQWHAIALITRKILFSKRPMAIVGIEKRVAT